MKLTSSASFSLSIRISLRLKIHQAQAKNFCRVLDIRVAEGMVVERHFEFMVDNPGAVLGVSQSEFINRLLLFDDTIRKYQKMLDSSGKKKYSEYTFGAPATINDAGCSHIAEKAVKKILGEDGLALYTKTPGGEDFAYMLERRPGIYAFVGCRNEAQDQCYPLHHKRFDLDEEGMLNGCAFYIQYVLDIQDKI